MKRRGTTIRWRGKAWGRLVIPSHRVRFGFDRGWGVQHLSLGWLIVTRYVAVREATDARK